MGDRLSCHTSIKHENIPNILLIGPPNVGKSVIFNYLTGMGVSVGNYAGTTVEYTSGQLLDSPIMLMDVPGTYALHANNEAEEVAVKMLDSHPLSIICVLDALHLESSLYLLLQVLERGIPTLVVINRLDLLHKKGGDIDTTILSQELGVMVITTVAIKGEGIHSIKESLPELKPPPMVKEVSWEYAEDLYKECSIQKGSARDKKDLDQLLVKPLTGLPLAILILALIFSFTIGVGMGLRRFLLLPLFRVSVVPLMEMITSFLPEGVIHRILMGEYGVFIKGIEWPFTLVLPYVLSFHLSFSFLEDSGYLPRLGVLLDGLFNRIGLKGSSIIPLLLGYGCGIPGILSTRALSSKKERIIISGIICLAVPCVAQTGAFISLLAESSIFILLWIFFIALLFQIVAGLVLDRLIKSPSSSYTLMEIPELLMPRRDVLLKKILLRLKQFLKDGALPMVGAVGVAAILYETGLMYYVGWVIRPLVSGWLNLPEEAAVPLLLGIFRREMAVLPLMEMDLTSLQLFTGALVGLFYVPCIAMIATLAREFKLTMAIGVLVSTTLLAFLLGGAIAHLGGILL